MSTEIPPIFTKDTKITRNNDLFTSQVDEDIVMMDDKAGLYFGLSAVARKIWELLDQPITHEQLLQALMAAYDVTYEQCRKDLDVFLQQMLKRELIHTTNE